MGKNINPKRVGIFFVAIIVLVAILAPVAYFATRSDKRKDTGKSNNSGGGGDNTQQPRAPEKQTQRIDCFPENVGVTKDKCKSRNCLYESSAPQPGVPSCFFPVNKDYGFSADKRTTYTPLGFRVKLQQKGTTPFEPRSKKFIEPTFEVEYLGENLIRFKLYDKATARYEVPVTMNIPTTKTTTNTKYNMTITDRENFAFEIKRVSTGTKIFDSSVGGLTLTDQFLQISTQLPSSNMYGFGENIHKSFKHDMNYKTWPMFSRDQPPGRTPMANLYGVHPFYTCVEDVEGNSHGVFFLNSNAQEYSLTPSPMLTYRTIGGILDVYVFLGPTPENVIQQYTEVIGRPFMPPYWALGFQLCRYGYKDLNDIKSAVNNTKSHNIPHDVQYADIDHMDTQVDFTINQDKFGGINDYFKELQKDGMHTIIILDPCLITNKTGYEPYDRLRNISGAVMWPDDLDGVDDYKDTDGAMLGYVWPEGKVVFPDFFKNRTRELWKDLIVKHRDKISYDGIWIDMNEPANFGTNKIKPWNWPTNATFDWSLKCPNSDLDDPPYKTKAAYVYNAVSAKISDNTLCMVARQGDNNDLLHYNVHSLYGWSQSLPTLQATREATGKRSMVLSRSTFPGSGKHIGHWLGDNDSQWTHLKESIIGMLEFNLFGIPYIGADICGFFKNTTNQLCKRWMQLGAFYPFSRNHNGIDNIPQDPGVLGAEVANASREALETRYWLLPYLYTLFHRAHVNGHTVARPIHHEFPNDAATLTIDEQFLWGASLLISPILFKNQTKLNYYVPAGRWYDFYTGLLTVGPVTKEIDVYPDTKIQLHVRGGSILPMQEPARNTVHSRKNKLHILVALDDEDEQGGKAEGELFWDDGDSIDTYENGMYYMAKFKAERNKVWSERLSGTDDVVKGLMVDTIKIYGVTTNVVMVTDLDNLKPIDSFTYDNNTKVLTVSGLNRPLKDWFSISWTRESTPDENKRIDCFPERLGNVDIVTKEKCENRHCVYNVTTSLSPDCYFSSANGYKMTGYDDTELGIDYNLTWKGTAPFGNVIKNAIFRVEMREDYILRFKLFDADKERYEVPIKLDISNDRAHNPNYELKVVSDNPFYFQVIRTSSKKVIWDTTVGGMTFEDQFLQIATKLPSTNVYGFGENVHGSLRHDLNWKTWPMFARDQPTGDQNFQNHYGVHPFYICMENVGYAHGVLLMNSNSQEYSFTPLPMLIYRSIGGILDFYLFMGPTPERVVYDYTNMIGKPYLPPYWSLGFQLCRYGYNNLTNLKDAVDRTIAAKIPLDVQYADIDHMDERMDFTIDDVNFSGLNNYFKSLQSGGMRTITILDPALISNVTGYKPYELMMQNDANIKWPTGYPIPANSSDEKGALLGYVWPKGKVVFPDFFKNVTHDVWKQLIVDHHSNLSFDGLWIDMNEPANFDTNKDRVWNWPVKDEPYWSLKCNKGDKYEDPPFRTMAAYLYDNRISNFTNRISDKTICMVATQGENNEFKQYDVHNLYGWSQTPPTLDALQAATGKQGIVISRSTFPGSGKYAGHWLGDNSAIWQDMKLSIIGALEFNMFGIPYIGADICGFFGDTNNELCKRWMQLGAFYTFSRNHNGFGTIDQDPAALGEDVAKAAREALTTRYWLLPYLHTLFYSAHTGYTGGGTIIRPLHHEFIEDTETYGIDEQFMWGKALMISPILRKGQTTLKYYLPRTTWYDWYTGIEVNYTGSNYYEMDVQPDTPIPLHIRGGYILPLQEPANNTHFSRKNPFTLKVALTTADIYTYASGILYWDDGEGKDNYEKGNYYLSVFACRNGRLDMDVYENKTVGTHGVIIDNIEVLGIDEKTFESVYFYVNGKQHHQNYVNYTKEDHIVRITNLGLPLHNRFTVMWKNSKTETEDVALRVDCFPDIDQNKPLNVSKQECERRGCIWSPVDETPLAPHCFINTTIYGYEMTSAPPTRYQSNSSIDLQWKNKSQMFQDDIKNIQMIITKHNEKVLQVKVVDPSSSRYEVPVKLNNISQPNNENAEVYDVQYSNNADGIFFLNISRRSTGTVIWDTSVGGLTFADQFLQFVTKLPSKNVYGFGENRHKGFRHNFDYQRWPMFSRDNGVNGGEYANLYGVHPFYMCVEEDGNAHGVLLLNSNAMEIVLQPHPTLTYRTVGGILDFYLFFGPTPENVIQQYTSLIGKPYLPPYWALGFQLCKYGYNDLNTLKEATERTITAKIPFDVQYADIDHMDERMDFTIDNVNFGGLPGYVKELQSRGMHFIIILDPALITNVTGYEPYEKGLVQDVFIKWPNNTSPDFDEYNNTNMLGFVWPKGKAVFPDFLNPKTHDYWKSLIVNHHQNISFDGLWIDMNEPANFGTNENHIWNWPEKDKPYWSLKCPHSKFDDPPYKPRGIYGGRLSDKTLCMVGLQNDGKYQHYNVHSLYGWSQTQPTLEGLRQATGQNKRGMVISRSTFPSSGKYAGHWLGDNNSDWPDLHYSIIGIMEFNLFGIPYIGADICGFFGDSNAELCQRWMQLGAFYTFSRNHNTIGAKPQDPASFGQAVADSSRRALEIKYYLLPYLYSLFYQAHSKGGTVIRSLVHNFPSDRNTWDIDTQFMWGSGLMFAPVLKVGKVHVDVYFPEGRWYDYYSGKEMTPVKTRHVISAPRDFIPIFIRGGIVIPTQHVGNTTVFSRKLGMGLLVSLDENDTAVGRVYLDDGETVDAFENGNYHLLDFSVKNKTLSMNIVRNNTEVIGDLVFDHVVIYGISQKPTSILINGVDHSQLNNGPSGITISYREKYKLLRVTRLNLPLGTAFTFQWN